MIMRHLRALTFALLLAQPAIAAQGTIVGPTAGPKTMLEVMTTLNAALLAIQSCNSGSSAPANGVGGLPTAYQCWADTSGSPTILFKTYDGASWVTFGSLNTSTHIWTPYRNGAAIVAVATSGSAADLTAGTLPAARLPNPSVSTLGGVQSLTCSASQWLTSISTLGVPACAQPNFIDIAGTVALAQLPAFSGMTAAAAAADADTFPTNQGAGNLKQTLAAIKTWIKAWIVKADVGLGNVDNTSDATKWGATKTLTNTTFACNGTGNSCVVRIGTDVTGLGTGIAAALAINTGSAGSPVLFNGAGGTPSSLVGTNITGTAAGLTAGNVTTNANLTGEVTSVGNATTIPTASVIGKLLTAFAAGAGTVSSSDSILTAIQKIVGNIALKADIASPTFTGTPAAPTAAADTNTTQLATTAYVVGQKGTANPLVNGTVAPGSSPRYAPQDHVHPIDTSRAAAANSALTGITDAQGTLKLSSFVTSTQLTANANDYTGTDGSNTCSTKGTLRISTNASRNISGLSCGQAEGDLRIIHNVGAFPAVLTNQDAASTAANRFLFGGDLTLAADASITLRYDGVALRWRAVVSPGASGGGGGGVTSVAIAAGTGISVSGTCTITTSGTCTISATSTTTPRGDAAYTILSTDRVVATNAALTASRTWTLPSASAFGTNAVTIEDAAGGVSQTNMLTIARAGSDTIEGLTSLALYHGGSSVTLRSNGSNRWKIEALVGSPFGYAHVHRGGTTSPNVPNNQTGTASIPNKVQFTNKTLDTQGAFDAVTNYRYTAQLPGLYQVIFGVRAGNNSDTPQLSVYKNGTVEIAGPYISAGMSGSSYMTFPATVFLDAGDYLEFYVYLPPTITTIGGLIGDTYAKVWRVGN